MCTPRAHYARNVVDKLPALAIGLWPCCASSRFRCRDCSITQLTVSATSFLAKWPRRFRLDQTKLELTKLDLIKPEPIKLLTRKVENRALKRFFGRKNCR